MLPVSEGLSPLVGAGLQRGSTVSVEGPGGAISLTLGLIAQACRQGAWVGVLGGGSLGLAAMEEHGIPLHQVVLVDAAPRDRWLTVTSAMIDGFDLVVAVRPPRANNRDLRLLRARLRERRSVLFRLGGAPWPERADLECRVERSEWVGLGAGHGYLQGRMAEVAVLRRRGAGAQRRLRLWLPDDEGRCRVVQPRSAAGSPHLASTDLVSALPTAFPDGQGFAGSDIDELIAESERPTSGSTQAADSEGGTDRHLRRVV